MTAGRTIDITEIEAQRSALLGHCYRIARALPADANPHELAALRQSM